MSSNAERALIACGIHPQGHSFSPEEMDHWLSNNLTVKSASRLFGISKSLLNRANIKQYYLVGTETYFSAAELAQWLLRQADRHGFTVPQYLDWVNDKRRLAKVKHTINTEEPRPLTVARAISVALQAARPYRGAERAVRSALKAAGFEV